MPGAIKNPVECPQCKRLNLKDGSEPPCSLCRMRNSGYTRRKYIWKPAWDDALRAAYREGKDKTSLGEGFTHVERLTGFPRHIIRQRAGILRLTADKRKPWTPEEIEFLREHAGELSIRAFRIKFKRTYYSVTGMLERLKLSYRVTEGYSISELHQVLGAPHEAIRAWLARGWLRLNVDKRIPEHIVRQFIKQHPEQYRLNRVDEAWFKGMLFPGMGLGMKCPRKSSADQEARV